MKKPMLYIMACSLSALPACRPEPPGSRADEQAARARLQEVARPLQTERDLDGLLSEIGPARYVLLGESSHGTAEFYEWRAMLTRRLIQEKGFTLVTVEGDWPDAYALNQYVQGQGAANRAADVLRAFDRWPTWMWANTHMADLADWLRAHNAQTDRKVGFYGLDVYSLWRSLDVLAAAPDAQTAALARQALACFDGYRGDEQAYALATLRGTRCQDVLNQLLDQAQTRYGTARDPVSVNLLQNALVAVNAEQYYYTMVRDDAESWNIRDRHMAATLDRLTALHGPAAKVIVWAHNTHVGDARYTDMARYGMTNLGQLVRESHADAGVYIVGFGTYRGTVIAANRWGEPYERMNVPAAPAGSWDALLHGVSPENKWLPLSRLRGDSALAQRRGQRAIGVVYQPAREQGNYVPTRLTERYDGFVFIDQTQALEPLPVRPQARRERSEPPVGQYALIND